MSTNSRIKQIENRVNFSGNALKKVSLGGKDTQNVKKVTDLMVNIVKRQRMLWRKEIDHWQQARYARYSLDNPQNYLMQELYEDIILDGHLTGITENRTLRTTNKNYIFAIDNIKDDKLTTFIEGKQWFEDTLQFAHQSTYVGGSPLFVSEFVKGEIKKVELVPLKNVIPEKRCILYDISSNKGIDFTDIKDFIWYSEFYNPVGILEKAAVYTILKRHSWGSWDEFEELFGIPIRIAKIASQSDTVKNEVAGWLEEMGSAPYGVFPLGTEVEIKENSKTDSFNVFFKKIEALDKELSKLILHQTMTTENGSSKAQGSVHENTLEQVVYSDEKKMIAFLNDVVVPGMRLLGYNIPENARIIVEKTKDPNKQILIDKEFISGGYILKQDYIESTYGTEIESMPTSKTPEPEPQGKD